VLQLAHAGKDDPAALTTSGTRPSTGAAVLPGAERDRASAGSAGRLERPQRASLRRPRRATSSPQLTSSLDKAFSTTYRPARGRAGSTRKSRSGDRGGQTPYCGKPFEIAQPDHCRSCRRRSSVASYTDTRKIVNVDSTNLTTKRGLCLAEPERRGEDFLRTSAARRRRPRR